MVKIDLITGFLGSGKTTFIRKYAQYLMDAGNNIGILENDYGASVSGRKGIGFQRIYRGGQRLSCKYQTCDENEEQRALYAKR